ncbi:hypothetical protein [Sandarakinorhabdus sp.]|uniref:hypothetical protein n=1 Tax=Sandarakinorhabdus sp. TaxID=1916663 RepID=UPI003562CC56
MNRFGFLDLLVRSEPFRVFQIVLGCLLLPVAGIVGVISPAPIGIVIFGFGVALVFRNSRWARRRYLFYTRHSPRVRRAVDFGLRRGRGRGQGRKAAAAAASLTKRKSDPTSPTMPQV